MDLLEMNYFSVSKDFTENLVDAINNAKKEITVEDAEDFAYLVDNLKQKAISYAQMRQDWEYYSLEQKREKDGSRTIKHDAFIDSVNMLLRFINKIEQTNILEAFESMDRKQKGDVACWIACNIAISNR